MLAAGVIIAAAFGAVVASFLNVCIDRLPAGESLVFPPSHCGSCGKRLGARDLVPILSFLFLRGRCRYCGVKLPNRLVWVEAGTAALFGYLLWHYGLSWDLALALFYGALFVVLSVIDLERQLILNRIVYPAAVVVLVVSIFLSPARFIDPGGTDFSRAIASLPQAGILQALIGGAAGLVVFTLIIILSRGGMGWGDAKLAGLIGAMTGYLVPVAIFVAVIIGGLLAILLLALRLKKRKEGIPFGPFLALGGMITVLWGADIANWYLGRFS